MNQEKNPNKKKVLRYYLILAASILVIAAITVTVIFAVNRGDNSLVIDGSQTEQPDKKPDDNPPDVDDKPTINTKTDFLIPVETVNLTNSFVFGEDKTLKYWHYHTGIDLTADEGAKVFACIDGTVESITTDAILDGTVITLSHENGLKTVYMFVDANSALKVGDSVNRGSVIGTVAAAGGKEYKEGPHLHFEVLKNGDYADPEDYLDIDNK